VYKVIMENNMFFDENTSNAKGITVKKWNNKKMKIALFCLVVTSCLGETLNIFGIKASILCAFGTLFFFLIDHVNNPVKFSTNEVKRLSFFVFFWLFYATLQMVFILNNDYVISSYLSLVINIFLIIMLATNIFEIKDIIFINRALILGLVINLLIAYWEIYSGNHLVPLDEERLLAFGNKPIGVFGNINDLATFLCWGIIALILNFSLTHKNIFITGILIIASVYILLVINARAPIYGILLYGFSIILCYVLFIVKQKSKIIFKFIIAFGSFIVVTFFLITTSLYTLDELILIVSSEGNQGSDLYRLELIISALSALINTAFLGVGPGQSIVVSGINVHNFFIEIMVEYGLVVIGGIVSIFIYMYRMYKWNLPLFLSSCVMSFPAAFFLISISSSGANKIRATWIIITIIFMAVSISKKNKGITGK